MTTNFVDALKECGYSLGSAQVMKNRLIRETVISESDLPPHQLLAALKHVRDEKRRIGTPRIAQGLEAMIAKRASREPEPSPERPIAPAVQPEYVDLPADLGTLLGRPVLPKIRKAPDQRLYSLADVGGAILGKDSRHAAEDLRGVCAKFPDFALDGRIVPVKFTSSRHRPVDVKMGDLALVVEYIMLLPGRVAAAVRRQAASLLVRYLGGDKTLVEEIYKINHVQEYLNEVDPTNWRTVFAAVEPLREPVIYDEAPERVGSDHMYALQAQNNLYKIGRSKNPLKRSIAVSRSESVDLVLVAIWKNEAHLEPEVHRMLASAPPDYGFKSTEFHIANMEQILAAVDKARQLAKIQPVNEEPEFKRRRVEVEVASLELALEEKKHALEERKQSFELEMEKKRLALEKDKWEFEEAKI